MSLLGAIADTSQHPLLHDEMGHIERGVSDGATAATTSRAASP
jgi:hypothetical protein